MLTFASGRAKNSLTAPNFDEVQEIQEEIRVKEEEKKWMPTFHYYILSLRYQLRNN